MYLDCALSASNPGLTPRRSRSTLKHAERCRNPARPALEQPRRRQERLGGAFLSQRHNTDPSTEQQRAADYRWAKHHSNLCFQRTGGSRNPKARSPGDAGLSREHSKVFKITFFCLFFSQVIIILPAVCCIITQQQRFPLLLGPTGRFQVAQAMCGVL